MQRVRLDHADPELAVLWLLMACTGDPKDSAADPDDTGDEVGDAADPFADAVVSFAPGAGAGFGQDGYPDVVLGAPEGGGTSGGLDVLSLGEAGVIVLAFDDLGLVDGDGVDLLVFENPFAGWYETGVVAASADGATWSEWPCDADDAEGGYPGCAGVALVYASTASGVDATDPAFAGGDRYDLADIGLAEARYVRIRDSGANSYEGTSGGFDLDAVAVVNGVELD